MKNKTDYIHKENKTDYNVTINLLSLITSRARKFKPIWREQDYNKAYALCNEIRKETDVPEYTLAKFDEGYQYRRIFHEDWKTAKNEFINVVFGWW